MEATTHCPMCGSPVGQMDMRCRTCGETLQLKSPPTPNHPGSNPADVLGKVGGSLLLLMSAAGFAILGVIFLVVLAEEPLLRFDDQVTGVVDGTVFVWTMDDRPAAIASVWIRKTGHEFHEFQSLAAGPLVASNQGQPQWTPAAPGIERKPAPDTEPPAATAARRLNQMRGFTREYSATVTNWDDTEQALRLLSQPVYRYGRIDGDVVDGVVFAFCKGTNPEILLIVEAVQNGKELTWKYAFARMTSRGCAVHREDKEVWSVPLARTESPTDPYFNLVQGYTGPGANANATRGTDN